MCLPFAALREHVTDLMAQNNVPVSDIQDFHRNVSSFARKKSFS